MEKLNTSQIEEKLNLLEGWTYKDGMLCKTYKFRDFKETFSIMTRIAFECEKLNHHPDWENVYNNLSIKLNTHDVDGITQKDFDLAQKIEAIIKT